jgi:hypothetical protein
MSDPVPENKKVAMRRIVNVALATAGLWFFVYLVGQSGVSLEMFFDFGWQGFVLLLMASVLIILFDTIAWYFAVAHIRKPSFWRLFALRIAGDALTNGLPGGVVLGETYKAVMMRKWFGVSLADNAAILLTIRFGLGLSQALYVMMGLTFSYPLLRDNAEAIVGFSGTHYIGLAVTIGMALLMLLPVTLMFRGSSFAVFAGWIMKLPSKRLRRWLESRKDRIDAIDEACKAVLHNNRKHLLLVFGFLWIGWVASGLESYVLLSYMMLGPTIVMSLVMESVGSLFRLVFFMVPSGIGGQDASFLALFRLYQLRSERGGMFVVFKRFKELIWIGVGFLLVVIFRTGGGGEGSAGSLNASNPDSEEEKGLKS